MVSLMSTYKVSTRNKKSVEEIEIWVKDDWTMRRINGYRWGTFFIETNDGNPPEDITEENPDGVNMYDYFSDNADNGAELDSLDDGWYCDFEWPQDMPEEERQRLLDLWEEESYSGFESAGWSNNETECWFHGPLDIVKV
jgi:hypothetical protein